jgi:hypothetical protein
MNRKETLGALKAALIAVAITAFVVVVIQVAARVITGKTMGGVAVVAGVPVAFAVLWGTGLLRGGRGFKSRPPRSRS